MPQIPQILNDVVIEFADSANNNVDQKIIDALSIILKPHFDYFELKKIYISCANDSHEYPSRHVQGKGKAIDISRINGKKMDDFYSNDPSVQKITNSLQKEFETYLHRRENFGPLFKKKLGKPYKVSGHNDHIHFSVN